MKRKIAAAAVALAATAGVSIVSAPTADAYAYWKDGHFYGDTSYKGNISGVYVKVVGTRAAPAGTAQQYILTIDLYDTVTDKNRGAVQVRGWDKQTGKWTYYFSSPIQNLTGQKGHARGTLRINTTVTDTIIVQDGIYGKTYGTNSVAVFRRYAAG